MIFQGRTLESVRDKKEKKKDQIEASSKPLSTKLPKMSLRPHLPRQRSRISTMRLLMSRLRKLAKA